MCLNPQYVPKLNMFVKCNHCVECALLYNQEWAMRIMLEAKQYTHNCFVTLTYNDDFVPSDYNLRRSDIQKFLKRLRKHFTGVTIRYFYCGEYGERTLRPHFHIILFNCDFSDKYFFKEDKKHQLLFRSPTLEKLWTFGFSSVAEVTEDSAKYVSSYCGKALVLPSDKKVKPFCQASTRPGLGYYAVKPEILETGVYCNGKKFTVPRYFLKVLEQKNVEAVQRYKERQMARAVKSFIYSGYDLEQALQNANSVEESNFLIRSAECTRRLVERRKKYLKIFGKSLDTAFRLCYTVPKIITMRKSTSILRQ